MEHECPNCGYRFAEKSKTQRRAARARLKAAGASTKRERSELMRQLVLRRYAKPQPTTPPIQPEVQR